jgi:serine/threonine protein kinase
MTLPVGAVLQDTYGERYRVDDLLGRGGFGAVYLVSDRQTRQKVFALKEVIDPSGPDRKRLLFECEVLKRLDHKSLPRVHHIFEHEKLKRVYLLMEYIKGQNLEVLRHERAGQRFPLDVTLAMMTPIVNALIYLHQQDPPIVHRDIKPANIIMPLDGNEAVLVDFGTAKEYLPEGTITIFGHFSPGYAALEQYSARSETDFRTDVYGLGATLYTLLTGVIPVDAVARITAGKVSDPLKPADTLVPSLPKPVAHALHKALSLYREDRYPSIEEFWSALHATTIEEQEQPAVFNTLPETPRPPFFDEEEEPLDQRALIPISTSERQQNALARLRNTPSVIISAIALVVLMLGLGLGLLIYTLHTHSGAPTTASSASSPVATAAPRFSASPTPETTPSTTTTATSLYPPVSPAYAGEITDLGVANTRTNLYFSHIQQKQAHISGDYQGLGQVGTFQGSVTASGAVNFTVKIASGTRLVFSGNIKVGGDIVGSFEAFDAHGTKLDEYGIWNVSASSHT